LSIIGLAIIFSYGSAIEFYSCAPINSLEKESISLGK